MNTQDSKKDLLKKSATDWRLVNSFDSLPGALHKPFNFLDATDKQLAGWTFLKGSKEAQPYLTNLFLREQRGPGHPQQLFMEWLDHTLEPLVSENPDITPDQAWKALYPQAALANVL